MSVWTRKIQKTGPQVLGVNLPKPWVRFLDLDGGNKLKILQDGEELILRPVKEEQ